MDLIPYLADVRNCFPSARGTNRRWNWEDVLGGADKRDCTIFQQKPCVSECGASPVIHIDHIFLSIQ